MLNFKAQYTKKFSLINNNELVLTYHKSSNIFVSVNNKAVSLLQTKENHRKLSEMCEQFQETFPGCMIRLTSLFGVL